MFTIDAENRDKVIGRFATMTERVHQALLKKVHALTLGLKGHIIRDKLQGQVLHKITGRLQGSIQSDVTDSPTEIIGRVYSSTAATPYNRAHEYGAVIPDRRPVKAQAMRFMVGGQAVFCKFARGFTLPERSYMRSGLADFKPMIISEMEKAAVMEAQK